METTYSPRSILLASISFGSMSSIELQLLIDSELVHNDFESLARIISGISISNDEAKESFLDLIGHQKLLSNSLGRKIGIKVTALDYIEHIDKSILKNHQLTHAELSKLAFQDDLTGLANFRYFNLRIKDEASRAKRYSHLMSIIMIDIDHFKAYNDSFGHPEGNDVLSKVASIIKSHIRETDMAARYGGEEFSIILPETNKQEAIAIAERIRLSVAESTNTNRPITVSCGVATYIRDTNDSNEVVGLADKALYEAKNTGRNKIVSFELPKNIELQIEAIRNDMTLSPASVVGIFNNWDIHSDELTFGKQNGKHIAFAKLGLPVGRYEYKFYINGRYQIDPMAKEFSPDGFGGTNCVLHVE